MHLRHKLLHPAASLTEKCKAPAPWLLQAPLAELNGLLLSLAVPAVLNGLLPHRELALWNHQRSAPEPHPKNMLFCSGDFTCIASRTTRI